MDVGTKIAEIKTGKVASYAYNIKFIDCCGITEAKSMSTGNFIYII